MGKVKMEKMASAAYTALATKDPEKLYFVNQTGDFGPENLEQGGNIYLGGKLLSSQTFDPTNPMSNQQGTFFAQLGAASTTSAWVANIDGLTAYYVGLRVTLFASMASTTATTLNINGLGAVAIRRYGGTAPQAAIPAGAVVTLTYVLHTDAENYFELDYYYDSTYNLATNNEYHYGFATSAVGHFYGSLCAFTVDGLLSSFTTTGQTASTSSFTYGRQPVSLWFPVGCPIIAIATYLAPNTQQNSVLAFIRTNYCTDMRYSMNYAASRLPLQTHNQFYMKVEVNRNLHCWRPVQNATVGDHIVTQLELEADCFYIHLGNSYSGTRYYMQHSGYDKPLLHYDGSHFVPYHAWLVDNLASGQLADDEADIEALQHAVDGSLQSYTDTVHVLGHDADPYPGHTSLYYPAAGFYDAHLQATLQNTADKPGAVEVKLSTERNEGTDEEPDWVTDHVLAVTQAYLPACDGGVDVLVPVSLYAPFELRSGMRLCVSFKSHSTSFSYYLRSSTTIGPTYTASQLWLRRWHTVDLS